MTTSLPELRRDSSAVSIRAAIAFGDWPPATPSPFCPRCGYHRNLHRAGDCPGELDARRAWGDR